MSYPCRHPRCNASFNDAPDWQFHTLTVHANQRTIWICPQALQDASIGLCHAGYRRACDLRTHLRETHGLLLHHDETVSKSCCRPRPPTLLVWLLSGGDSYLGARADSLEHREARAYSDAVFVLEWSLCE